MGMSGAMKRLSVLLAGLAGLVPIASGATEARPPVRDRLSVVAAGSAAPIAQALVRRHAEAFPAAKPPALDIAHVRETFERFCAGTGHQTPDIAIVPRRMPRAVAELCKTNGVGDIVEQSIGLGAVVLAVKRGDDRPALASQQVWAALAAERPAEEQFLPNTYKTWAEIGSHLPAAPIRVLVPDADSNIRGLFEEFVLETGCRFVKEIRMVYAAGYRRSKCVTLRRDAAVRVLPADAIPSALLASPPGTIAVMSLDQLLAGSLYFLALPIDGILPTPASIAAQHYEATQLIYVYAKRHHEEPRRGPVIARGIGAFLAEAASEPASGPGGYLTLTGLVPSPPETREAQRNVANRLTRMSR
jgi:phosphate transport system substrate-binding protein